MRVIAYRPLRDFGKGNPLAKGPLDAWYAEATRAAWKEPQEIKRVFASASFLADNRVVFNIGGNKYRLVVKINYAYSVVYVRFVGTHAEYDRIDANTI